MSETIREHALETFAAKADSEAKAAADRREAAEKEGVVRGPYAKEGRWRTALDALTAVPGDRWTALADWLSRFARGPDAPPIKDRLPDRKLSWKGAERDALNRTIKQLKAALARVRAAQGIEGLDAEQKSDRDMEGRLGRSFHELRYKLDEATQHIEFAIGRLEDPFSAFDDDPDDEQPPFDLAQRNPAARAFPELMRFWTEDAGQPADRKALFKTFASVALSAAAKAAGDSPAEWTAGLDEAFKLR